MLLDSLHLPERSDLRAAIDAATRRAESACLHDLLPLAELDAAAAASARELATTLVVQLRASRTTAGSGDALRRSLSVPREGGGALMCWAKALPRIPDQATADALIRDKLARGNWRAHVGNSPSLFVNAAAWGLLVSGRLVATHSEEGLGAALARLLARGGEPLIRKGVDLALRLLGRKFVTGETIAEALARARQHEARGYRYSYDMLGEAALTDADARRYLASYEDAIHAIGAANAGRGVVAGPGISVKLSALHPRYAFAQRDRVLSELLPRLRHLCLLAQRYDIGLAVDAEESERLSLSLDLIEALLIDPQFAAWRGLGVVVQAYQKRAPLVIDWLIDAARRARRHIMVRLVKGAYWDSEVKRAQVEGQSDYPVFTRKVHTDVSYLACARKLLAATDIVFAQFATHNALTLATVVQMARAAQAAADAWEFQCLHGMGESLYDQVVGAAALDRPCRIYAPVGTHETLLAYLVRRLLENGANSSFVHRIVDPNVGLAELVADPVAATRATGGAPHPQVPLPANMFGGARRNSQGLDLNDEATLREIQRAMQPDMQRDVAAVAHEGERARVTGPLLASTWSSAARGGGDKRDARDVINSATGRLVGRVADSSAAEVAAALTAAQAFAPAWAATTTAARAALLERAADLFESNRGELMDLAQREAGKTLANALGEVREAVDFLRYYAQQARTTAAAHDGRAWGPALGPVACISPWNFPLAIFTGQIGAALVAGNVVLAKPAEQTPLIASAAVRLLREAGVPAAALQLLPGDGRVGAMLTSDARIRAVGFTGSSEVAALIDRALAARAGDEEIPLIAETGGCNAMIVDSSALPEQVVTDVVSSAFDSAGQRCSALRVLCLQDDIAERT